MRYSIFLMIFVLSFFFVSSYARRTVVTTAYAINNGSWSAGDTIVLKNGNWTNQTISLRAFGAEMQPIVLLAENSGDVMFNGSSRISISGRYIEISGIYFKDGTLSGSPVVEFRTSSSNMAEKCRLTDCAIANYNPILNTVDSKWISLYGQSNCIDHCSFENKTNSGTLLVVWLTSGIIPAHIIENNYFGYRNANLDANGDELNGQEIIRIGDSSTSMQYANVIVRNNFFERCNGEIEVISNKSCGNLYMNNLFFECKGMLTLRHGNDCTVKGNYFFGNGVSETGGVRVIGEDHKVYNNYFEKLRGTNYRSAICVVRGKLNSALSEYFQVKNARIMFNTMVDCSQSFSINYNSDSNLKLPPVGSVIAHNHVYNTSSSNLNVNIAQVGVESIDLTWKNNFMNTGKYTNFTYTGTEVITGKNANMQLVSTPVSMFEPQNVSALCDYQTDDYTYVEEDIRGRVRAGSSKVPGASEISGNVNKIMPAKISTGATFLNEITSLSAISDSSSDIPISILSEDNMLRISDCKMTGELHIYDLTGRAISKFRIFIGSIYENTIGKGVYIIKFTSDEGKVFSNKIIV